MSPKLRRHSQGDTELADLDIPRVRWDDVSGEFVESWDQGDHVIILGRTKSGKTTLALEMLRLAVEQRGASVIALGTKARDKTLRQTHWPIVRHWPPTYAQRSERAIVFWPPYTKPSRARSTTRAEVQELLDEVMKEGGWRLFIDEIAYLIQTLNLRTELDEYWNGARSSGISVIGGTQRPRMVARSGLSQPEWAVCFRINDLDDRVRAAEVLGDRKRYSAAIASLDAKAHEFVMVNLNTDQAVITRLDAPPKF